MTDKELLEPIAYLYEKELEDGFTERTLSFGYAPEFEGKITPLYIPLCKKKPLYSETIKLLWESTNNVEDFARLIEKAHGITDESTI